MNLVQETHETSFNQQACVKLEAETEPETEARARAKRRAVCTSTELAQFKNWQDHAFRYLYIPYIYRKKHGVISQKYGVVFSQ